MRLLLTFFSLFVFSSVANSEEVICHFDIETDQIGQPSCDGHECTFEMFFPNYENHRILRASLRMENGGRFFATDLALKKYEDKASSVLHFSKSDSFIEIAAFYQLKSCVGHVKYEIQNGMLKTVK